MVIEDRSVEFTTPGRDGRDVLSVRKRDGRTVPFDRGRIAHAIEMAFRAGVGVLHSEAADDTTGLKFGTPFAITFGAGVKFVTRRVGSVEPAAVAADTALPVPTAPAES